MSLYENEENRFCLIQILQQQVDENCMVSTAPTLHDHIADLVEDVTEIIGFFDFLIIEHFIDEEQRNLDVQFYHVLHLLVRQLARVRVVIEKSVDVVEYSVCWFVEEKFDEVLRREFAG